MAEIWVSYPELSDLIGADAARALCACLGGVPVYVPRKAADAASARTLARIVGPRALDALCAAYGGAHIAVPNGRRAEPLKRRALAMLEAGRSRRDIALELGLTERYVRQLARQLRNAADTPRQCTLFD